MTQRSRPTPTTVPAAARSRYAAAVLLSGLSCTPLRDLSSYSGAPAESAGAPVASPAGESPGPGPGDADRRDAGPPGMPPPDAASPSRPASAVVSVTGALDAGGACDAPGELAAGGACYSVADEPATWSAASAACADWGGALARIDTPEEDALLVQNATGDAWIGLNDRDAEGEMRWEGGGELGAFSRWAALQPDDFDGTEDCVELLADGRGWNDRPCTDLRVYFCER